MLDIAKLNDLSLGTVAVADVAAAISHIEDGNMNRKERPLRKALVRAIQKLPEFDKSDKKQRRRLHKITRVPSGRVLERTNFLLVRAHRLPASEIKPRKSWYTRSNINYRSYRDDDSFSC